MLFRSPEAASAGCPKAAAPSRRRRSPGPFSKGVRLGVSTRPRAAASPSLRLRINSPASGHPPASHSSFHPPSPSASAWMPLQFSRGRFPRAPRLSAAQPPPQAQAPFSPPSAAAAPALGSGPGRLASGVASGRAGPATPPGSALRRPLCARRQPLHGAPSTPPPCAQTRRKGRARDNQGTGRGAKDDSTHSGKVPAWCCLWVLLGLAPTPASPPRQGRGKGGRGRSGATGTALEMVLPELQGRGSSTVLVSLRRVRGTRRLEKGP